MPLTTSEIVTEIQTRLGSCGVRVELGSSEILICLKQGLRLMSRFTPGEYVTSLNVSSSQKKYVLDPAAHPEMIGVILMDFLDNERDEIEQSSTGGAVENPAGEYTQHLMSEIDKRVVFSQDIEWKFQWEVIGNVRKPVLYVDIAEFDIDTYSCSYTWVYAFTPDDNKMTGLPSVSPTYEEWLLDFTEALAKQILGRKLDKFKGIPSSDGGDLALDGAELKQEGIERERELREDILQRKKQFPVLWG